MECGKEESGKKNNEEKWRNVIDGKGQEISN